MSSNAAIWCFCPMRPEPAITPLGFAAMAITSASRGHCARWACKAVDGGVGPAGERKIEEAMWLASRAGTRWPVLAACRAARPPRLCLPASGPAPCPHGRWRTPGRWRWRDRTPRPHPDRGSAPDRSPRRRRRARRRTTWTRAGVAVCEHSEFSTIGFPKLIRLRLRPHVPSYVHVICCTAVLLNSQGG